MRFPSTRSRSIQEVLSLFEQWGSEHYDEDLSQLAHALQTAALARADGADDDLVVAALLHDVGHLLEQADERGDRERRGDLRHEARGARYLGSLFPETVTRPIALHVRAKRYLCAVDAGYHDALSHGSSRSLALQGGPFTPAECDAFEQAVGWKDAVQLRRWDDCGKVDGLAVPPLEQYTDVLVRTAR